MKGIQPARAAAALPGIHGWKVVASLKGRAQIPVVIVSERGIHGWKVVASLKDGGVVDGARANGRIHGWKVVASLKDPYAVDEVTRRRMYPRLEGRGLIEGTTNGATPTARQAVSTAGRSWPH